MFDNLTKITEHPLLATGYLLLLAAALACLSSAGLLASAVLHRPDISALSTRTEPGSLPSIDPGAIGARNFFGFADATPEIVIDDLPETKLELTLRGAFTSAENENAGAIIENKETRMSEHYAIGEELPGDATLKAVYPDRVVLTRNGLLETLYFPDVSDTSGIGSRRNPTASNAGDVPFSDSEEARKRREAIRDRIKQLRGRR